jgi:hypothetical protein
MTAAGLIMIFSCWFHRIKVQVLRSGPALLMKITISELTATCAFQALAACTPPVIA